MKPGEIGTLLRTSNRWWVSKSWEADDHDLREAATAAFRYEPGPLRELREGGLYLLRGPRRVGKSVELKRAISELIRAGVEPRRVIHASLDGWRDADLGGLVDVGRNMETRGVAGTRYWFLDEVTAVTGDWPSRLKWLRDNDPGFRGDTVVLTGSSSRGLDRLVKALAGRRGRAEHVDRLLMPMGFGSFCRALGLDEVPYPDPVRIRDLRSRQVPRLESELHPWLNELTVVWELFLSAGGFPRAVDEQVRAHAVGDDVLESLWSVVHGEAVRSTRFSATQTDALLSRLTAGLGSPFNVAHAGRETDVPAETALARLTDLRQAYLVWSCAREHDLVPRLRAQAKLYFIDPLPARLARWRSAAYAEPELTALSEQQLGVCLQRALYRERAGRFFELDLVMHHRSGTGAEIDFVGPDFGSVAIESRYVEGGWGRAAQTLRASPWDGIVATRSVTAVGGDVWAIPTPILALLLDP